MRSHCCFSTMAIPAFHTLEDTLVDWLNEVLSHGTYPLDNVLRCSCHACTNPGGKCTTPLLLYRWSSRDASSPLKIVGFPEYSGAHKAVSSCSRRSLRHCAAAASAVRRSVSGLSIRRLAPHFMNSRHDWMQRDDRCFVSKSDGFSLPPIGLSRNAPWASFS